MCWQILMSKHMNFRLYKQKYVRVESQNILNLGYIKGIMLGLSLVQKFFKDNKISFKVMIWLSFDPFFYNIRNLWLSLFHWKVASNVQDKHKFEPIGSEMSKYDHLKFAQLYCLWEFAWLLSEIIIVFPYSFILWLI